MRGDLYDVLGLEPRASAEQVERAYRFCLELYGEGALATYSLLEPHEAEEQRQRVQEAYSVLADPGRRLAYDEGQGYLPPDASEAILPPIASTDEPELPTELTGAVLRRVREARGVSLRQIASVTKIGTRFLEYIEADRFAFLPPTAYLRGFLQEYARAVGLEPKQVSDAYLSRVPKKD